MYCCTSRSIASLCLASKGDASCAETACGAAARTRVTVRAAAARRQSLCFIIFLFAVRLPEGAAAPERVTGGPAGAAGGAGWRSGPGERKFEGGWVAQIGRALGGVKGDEK